MTDDDPLAALIALAVGVGSMFLVASSASNKPAPPGEANGLLPRPPAQAAACQPSSTWQDVCSQSVGTTQLPSVPTTSSFQCEPVVCIAGVLVQVPSSAQVNPVIGPTQAAEIQSAICDNTSSGNLAANDTIICQLATVAASLAPGQELLTVGTGIGAQTASVTTSGATVAGSVTPETSSEYLSSALQIQSEGGALSAYDISILQAAGLYTGTATSTTESSSIAAQTINPVPSLSCTERHHSCF